MEEAADGIFIPDPQGKLIDVNRHGCEMLGYSRTELLELTIMDLMPQEMRNKPQLEFDPNSPR